jgi:hypothetical protein
MVKGADDFAGKAAQKAGRKSCGAAFLRGISAMQNAAASTKIRASPLLYAEMP